MILGLVMEVNVVDYSPDLMGVFENFKALGGAQQLPNLPEALDNIAGVYKNVWVGFASGLKMPGTPRVINSRAGGYRDSIQIKNTGLLARSVFSDSKVHKYIEDGHGAIDLKPGMLAGKKSRESKSGGRYNIIPFRHKASEVRERLGMFDVGVRFLNFIKGMRKSPGTKTRVPIPAGEGKRSKLVNTLIAGAKPYTWKAGALDGLVRIDQSTGLAKSGAYMTFRVVSSKSDPSSWIVPPVPGIPIRDMVVKVAEGSVKEILKQALEDSLNI